MDKSISGCWTILCYQNCFFYVCNIAIWWCFYSLTNYCSKKNTRCFWKKSSCAAQWHWMATSFSRSDTLWFFLWYYLRSRIYKTQPIRLNDLQKSVFTEIKNQNLIRRSIRAIKHLTQRPLENRGGHVEGSELLSVVFASERFYRILC